MSGISSWFTVWVKPRTVVRQFLDSSNPTKNMIVISMAAGALTSLDQASSRSVGDQMPLFLILLLALVVGSLGGIVALYLGSALLTWVGGWLGGDGEHEELRVALTRGVNIPTIILGMIWVPQLLLFGVEMFMEQTPRIENSVLLTMLLLLFAFIEIILGIWIFVISLMAIGEAHGFSAWKALGTMLIALVLAMIVLGIFFLLFGSLLIAPFL